MNHSQEDIYNHSIDQAMTYCNMAKDCILNGEINRAKELLFSACMSFESAVEAGKRFNYEQAGFAEAKRKECLEKMQDLEFGRIRKVAENLER